jgi:exodeoxyribonuclease V alpha subunit
MKKPQEATEWFRITSIPFLTPRHAIFSGMPLKRDSYRTNSGKYFVTVKADPEMLPMPPAIGQHWTIRGTRRFDVLDFDGYGMSQHTYENPIEVTCDLPETGEQFIRFVANEKDFKGIGESKARALWGAFGKDLYLMLRQDTEANRNRLKALLSDGAVRALYKGYAKYRNLSYCNWMTETGIPALIQQRLLKHHAESSVEEIKSNPYLLAGFGMEFRQVDELARSRFALEADDPRRLSAALESALRKEVEKGHTYTEQKDLRPHLTQMLSDPALATRALIAGHDKSQYILNPETGTYHPTAQLLMESVIVRRLLKLADIDGLYDEQAAAVFHEAASKLPYPLLAAQQEAVEVTLDNGLSCITGGAGTGKTTVLRTALEAFDRLGYQIHPVALSGRAAMRLHESIGFVTMTIAALLKKPPIEPSNEHPRHVLVIDEASMVDIPTMYRLVTHIHPSVRIVLTGDPDQLSPIGCGKVLADIVASGVIADTRLDVVKRQEGSTGIPEYSNMINAGTMPSKLTMGRVTFHETAKDRIPETCTDLFLRKSNETRIIGATKKTVSDINKLVQQAANPDGKRIEFNIQGNEFFLDMRVGDVVLFTQNNYDKGIQNGSLGILTGVECDGDVYGTVKLDVGETVEISQALLDCMELGYAITLHKAQGSQFPRIVVALEPGRIVDRAWLYTAITRAEAEVHIVGSAADMKQIVEPPSRSHSRRSYLTNLLCKERYWTE